MFIGSAAFQTANAKLIQKRKRRGTIDDIPFTGDNILAGSLSITNQCSDGKDSKIGAVNIGVLKATFTSLAVTPRTWRGRVITLEEGLCVSENPDTYEWFQLGVWVVASSDHVADGVTVTAYDAMSLFDVALPDSYIISGSMHGILTAICSTCGAELGMTKAEVEALPNGLAPLGAYQPNDCTTYRDLIYWLSVTAGGFATINRLGKLVIRTYDRPNTVDATIDGDPRENGSKFSDWLTNFGSAAFENIDGSVDVYGTPGVGVQYSVGFDPFLQYGTGSTKRQMRGAVMTALQKIQFMPFSINLMSAPVFELGDIIFLTGGDASSVPHIGCVQYISYSPDKGLTLKGFGADPNLRNAQTGKDAASSAANRATAASEMVIKKYENLMAINVDDNETKVVEIDFNAVRQTEVEVWHEFQILTQLDPGETSMTVEAVYYLDGIEQDRRPVETYTDSAEHVLGLQYERPIDDPGPHTWEVYLVADGGTVALDIKDALSVLKGQGISKAEVWDGIIYLVDKFTRFTYSSSLVPLTDTVTVTLSDNETISLSDEFDRFTAPSSMRTLTESLSIAFDQPVWPLALETGELIGLETDSDYIETE